MVELGMTPIAALKAATSVDAELLGLSKSIGTLEPGKLADVVAVPGDPTGRHHRDRARRLRDEGRGGRPPQEARADLGRERLGSPSRCQRVGCAVRR